MLFAPPDVLSQTILAIPIWLLYEIGIFMSRFSKKGVLPTDVTRSIQRQERQERNNR